MVRSTGFSRLSGLSRIRRIVALRQSPTQIESITYTTNELDETVESKTQKTEDVWLYQGTSRLVQELLGERQTGTLNGIATTPVDIELDDRITYNGVEYDVEEVTPLPEDDPQIVAFGCMERQ